MFLLTLVPQYSDIYYYYYRKIATIGGVHYVDVTMQSYNKWPVEANKQIFLVIKKYVRYRC